MTEIVVQEADLQGAIPGEPGRCLLARAILRTMCGSKDVRVHQPSVFVDGERYYLDAEGCVIATRFEQGRAIALPTTVVLTPTSEPHYQAVLDG
jgi:hypothetical protein